MIGVIGLIEEVGGADEVGIEDDDGVVLVEVIAIDEDSHGEPAAGGGGLRDSLIDLALPVDAEALVVALVLVLVLASEDSHGDVAGPAAVPGAIGVGERAIDGEVVGGDDGCCGLW